MKSKRDSFAVGYLAAQMAILLLAFFFCAAPLHQQKIEPVFLWPAAIALLCLIWYRQGGGKPFPWDFFCLTAYVGWVYVTCVLNGDPYLEINQHFMLAVLLGFGVAYPAFRLFDADSRQRWFARFAGVVVALCTALGAVCLYCGFSGVQLNIPFCEDVLGLRFGRLYIFTLYPTENACLFTLVLILALYLLIAAKGLWRKLLLGGCAACLWVCVMLTVSRTGMICVSAGLGMFAFLLLLRALGKQKWLIRFASAAVAMALVAYGSFSLMLSTTITLAQTPAAALLTEVPVQPADAPAAQTAVFEQTEAAPQPTAAVQPAVTVKPNFTPDGALLQKRNLDYDKGTLTGRTDIWQAAIQMIRENPTRLLTGMSDAEVSVFPQRSIGYNTYHMHSVWMETLMLTGLPGLLLYLFMAVMLTCASIRLCFAKNVPLSQSVLAILPLIAMVNGLMEIYPSYSGKPMDLIFFLTAGAVVAFDRDRRAKAARAA